jgi:hypothetical protein
MTGANQILTVSYGTFSCTLEGFDNPFNTMKAIAEYFRDLAAEDRYFGAEPPQPDAAMLHKIAEREVQRRVEAKIGANSVTLRAESDTNVVRIAAPSAAATQHPVVQMPASPARRAETRAEEHAEQQAVPMLVDADRVTASVAAKLLRMRHTAVTQTSLSAAAFMFDSDGKFTDETDIFGAAQRMTAPGAGGVRITALPVDTAVASTVIAAKNADTPGLHLAHGHPVPLGDAPATDDTAKPAAPDAGYGVADDGDTPLPGMPGPLVAVEHGSEDIPTHEVIANETKADDHLTTIAALPGADTILFASPKAPPVVALVGNYCSDVQHTVTGAPPAATQTCVLTAGAMAAPVGTAFDAGLNDIAPLVVAPPVAKHPVATAPLADPPIIDVPAINRHVPAMPGPVRPVRPARQARPEPPVVRPPALPDGITPPEDLSMNNPASTDSVAAPATPDKLQRIIARVIRISRNEAVGDAGPTIIPSPADTPVTPTRITPRRPNLVASAGATSAGDRIDRADASSLPDGTPITISPPQPGARSALDPAGDEAVSRLMHEADTQMDGPDTRRRRSAIAHLKAAVAATLAERRMTGSPADHDGDDRLGVYRNDLAAVVRPPAIADVGLVAPVATGRPAPLVLVSAQRVDRPADAPPLAAQPCQASAPEAAPTAADTLHPVALDHAAMADTNLADKGGFPDFAGELGADTLPDLLEAAAAYITLVEGRDSFTRPELMRHITTADSAIGREEGLRNFGTLLRTGIIEKTQAGQFALSIRSVLLADARDIAG